MKILTYDVECLDRALKVVVCDADHDRAYNVLDIRYNEWNEDIEDVHDKCCEEWMLEGLKRAGIEYVEYPTEVYLIVSEWNGKTAGYDAFVGRDNAAERFEMKTGHTLEEFLSGAYKGENGRIAHKFYVLETED